MKEKRIVIAALALLTVAVESATAETYTVNTSSDNVVANACANHQSNCSLRGAITAANANPGSTIGFAINEFCPVSGCAITLLSPLPDISVSMSISPTSFAIQRSSSASTNFRIFNVTTTGTVNFTGLTIAKGKLSDANGAGIQNLNGGTVNVTNCIVRDNMIFGSGNASGAGICNSSTGTLNVTNSTFTANSDFFGGNGGGIFNGGPGAVNVNNSTFTANRANSGAGIAAGGTAVVTGCTFSANTAIGRGGEHNGDSGFEGRGGAILNGGTADISNSTFAGNSATGGNGFNGAGATGRGGAVFHGGASLSFANCTVFGNSASGGTGTTTGSGVGGGVETVSGNATIKSSLIALNSASSGPDVRGSFTSAGFNLIGKRDDSTGVTATTDLTGTIAAPLDPKLDPNGLQNNGGLTETVALLPGSPAIDKGSSSGLSVNLTTDQRGTGFPRVFDDSIIANAAGGDGTDIGAFELQSGQPTKLANISTRLAVQTGDNVLIGGFIITGTQPKKVILRAMGPSLNLPGQLANPTLELYTGSALLASNDDWQNQPPADRQAVIDSTIPPPSDLESALVRTLAANGTAYTAVVRGANNGTGIGVIEAFDLNGIADSKLANISTRGFVETGDNVLIAGTIILGNTPQKIIVRAIGPSLSVPGKMADPTLELRNQNGGLVEANDDWMNSPNKQAIIDSTVAPTDDKESAIVQTLPGNGASYTAIVRGVSNTTGIAVVEVYALQ
jgi:hypothetical protein